MGEYLVKLFGNSIGCENDVWDMLDVFIVVLGVFLLVYIVFLEFVVLLDGWFGLKIELVGWK